jgi:hypothetical protein
MATRLRSRLIRSTAILALIGAVAVPLAAPTPAAAQWGYYHHPHWHPYYHPYYRPYYHPYVVYPRPWGYHRWHRW